MREIPKQRFDRVARSAVIGAFARRSPVL